MRNALAATTDWVKLGLAANLKDYTFVSYKGDEVRGAEVLTHDKQPVAYASRPEELVNYVSAHDNETLFDIVMLKSADGVTLEERCRINHLATSVVALAQGIPFFHAGDELLRSKSLDRDSYNSGDWFNRLDFSYETNNWGVGLPPKGKNGEKWPLMRSLLGNPSLKPSKKHILAALANFEEFLSIRFSSPLFRLKTANAIQVRLKLHNTGPASVPGVIAFSLCDGDEGKPGLTQLDPKFRRIAVVINARPTKLAFEVDALKHLPLTLHPVQEASADEIVRQSKFEATSAFFEVPARTTAVFVEKR
jgi:pullulanase